MSEHSHDNKPEELEESRLVVDNGSARVFAHFGLRPSPWR